MSHPLGFAPESALEDLGLPLWEPGVEMVQLLGLQGFWQHQVPRGVGSYGSRTFSVLERHGKQYWPIRSSILAWRILSTWWRVVAGHSLQGCKELDTNEVTLSAQMQDIFCLWQLCPSESWVWRWHSSLSCGDPGDAKCAGTGTASATGVMALSEFFFRASCSWQSEGLFGQPFSIALPIQTFRGLPCLVSFSVVWHIRHMEGPLWLGSYSVVQGIRHVMGQPLCCSAANAGPVGREGVWW